MNPDLPDTVPLIAARYTGGPLGERVVVRLVPEPLVVAEDGMAATFGVAPAEVTTVGKTRAQAIGFPAWVIMQHPAQASNALNIDAELRRVMKNAGSKPGNAKDAVVGIAGRLERTEPGFLPTFYEQAARGFLQIENDKYAAMMFGKAREAEQTYSLPVDEHRHREAFLEFAQAGAVSAKVMSAEAKDLARRQNPDEALRLFRDLNLARTRGGLAPYAGLSADLNRLAKAAGVDVAAVRRGLVAELVTLEGIEAATAAGFWHPFSADITAALGAEDESGRRLRQALTRLVPRVPAEDWVGLVRAWGLADEIAADDPAAWLQQIFDRLPRWGVPPRAPKLTGFVLAAADRLTGRTLDLWSARQVSPDLLDALCQVGARVRQTGIGRGNALSLQTWAGDPERRDLRFLLADESLGPLLRDEITRRGEYVQVAAGIPALHRVLTEAADAAISTLGHRPLSLTTVQAASLTMNRLTAARELIADRIAVLERLARAGAQVFADTLQLGLVDEMAWPTAERVRAEQNPPTGTWRSRLLFDAWPAVGLSAGTSVRFVDGDREVGAGSTTARVITTATMIDGHIGVVTSDQGRLRVQWGNAQPSPLRGGISRHPADPSLPVPAGRMFGTTLVRVDSTEWTHQPASLFGDGNRVWVWPHDGDCHEIDPADGREIGPGLPPWLALQQQRFADRPELVLRRESTFRPATPSTAASPFSTSGGMHASAVFENTAVPGHWVLVAADGSALEFRAGWSERPGPRPGTPAPRVPIGAVLRPGGGLWVLTRDGELYDLATGQALPRSARAFLDTTGPLGWFHARPRDPEASRVLRGIGADRANRILRAVLDDLVAAGEDAEQQHRVGPRTDKAIQRLFGRPIAPELAASIAETAHEVWRTVALIDQLDADPSPQVAEQPAGFDATLDTARPTPLHWVLLTSVDDINVAGAVAGAADLLGTRPRKQPKVEPVATRVSWPQLIGREAALLFVAAAPHVPDTTRRWALDLFDHLARFGYLDHHWTVRSLDRVDPRELPAMSLVDKVHLITGAGTWVLTRGTGVDGPVGQWSVDHILTPAGPRDRTGLQALADRIRAGERFSVPEGAAAALAAPTGLDQETATLLLHGLPHFGRNTRMQNFLPGEVREALGLKATDAHRARTTLFQHPAHRWQAVLAAGVPDDPVRLLTDGPEVAAMATTWGGAPAPITLDAEHRQLFLAAFPVAEFPRHRVNALQHHARELEHSAQVPRMLEQLEWLAQHLPLDSPARPQVDRQVSALADLTEEHADLFAALHARLAEPPRPGYGLNPRVSAPEVVAAVAEEHGLSPEAATYYLQLLALPEPNDADVRRWNQWSARVLARAREELIGKNLVVAGKRARARRSAFLPGRWLDSPNRAPIEAWKGRTLGRLSAADRLGGRRFDAAWQTARNNPPGFDELETERRR